MDGNKDDALKSLKIGRQAMESGDRARAMKFLLKARRLDPDLPIDDLLFETEKQSDDPTAENLSGSAAKESSRSPRSKPSDQPFFRRHGSSTTGGSSSSSSSASYTEEQVTIVRKIKSENDYYEILGLERSCSVEDVRKAYRKLSLKVHPDKNKVSGSEEAFKAVSKAFQCLSNEENRKKYDISGSDNPVYQPRRAARSCFNGYYDDQFDADEIFRSFFFGGMPPATAQFRTFNFGHGMGPRRADHGSAGFNPRMLLQLLPVLLILLFSFLPSSQPVYSLSRSYPYEYKFTTQRSVNYYVRSSKFEQDYPVNSHERQRIENQVENDYYSILSQNCRLELQRRQWGFIRETPHCDMLQKFQTVEAS